MKKLRAAALQWFLLRSTSFVSLTVFLFVFLSLDPPLSTPPTNVTILIKQKNILACSVQLLIYSKHPESTSLFGQWSPPDRRSRLVLQLLWHFYLATERDANRLHCVMSTQDACCRYRWLSCAKNAVCHRGDLQPMALFPVCYLNARFPAFCSAAWVSSLADGEQSGGLERGGLLEELA